MGERPIRVCLLLGRYPPDFGGWGIQYQRLLPHLAREGVEARVVTPRIAAGVDWRRGERHRGSWRGGPRERRQQLGADGRGIGGEQAGQADHEPRGGGAETGGRGGGRWH